MRFTTPVVSKVLMKLRILTRYLKVKDQVDVLRILDNCEDGTHPPIDAHLAAHQGLTKFITEDVPQVGGTFLGGQGQSTVMKSAHVTNAHDSRVVNKNARPTSSIERTCR